MPESTYRYFIRMAYMGTEFNGWQVQAGSPSIQQTVEHALSLLLREQVRVTGAGRTDTGVHAKEFYAHFDSLHDPVALRDLQMVYRLNRILPGSIAIYELFPVHQKAHARFSAIERTYQYTICTRKDPFYADRSWLFERALNMETVREATALLPGYNDFTSFAKTNSQVKTTICTVREAMWESVGHLLLFRISADRFLRNMVRAITGSLVDVGLGKLGVGDFREIIEARDRRRSGYSAPARGLVLERVTYPEGLFMT